MSVAEFLALAVSVLVGAACLLGAQRSIAGLVKARDVPTDDEDQERARARAIADHGGRLAVVLVALIGVLVVVGPAVRYAEDVFDDPTMAEIQTETKTVVTTAPGASGAPVESERETTTTTKPRARSLLDRGFAPGGLLLLRIAIAAAAAFLAGAVTQRVLLGRYDIELGPGGVKLGALGESVEEQGEVAKELTQRLEGVDATTMERLARIDEGLAELAGELRETRTATGDTIGLYLALKGQVEALGQQIASEAASGDKPPEEGVS